MIFQCTCCVVRPIGIDRHFSVKRLAVEIYAHIMPVLVKSDAILGVLHKVLTSHSKSRARRFWACEPFLAWCQASGNNAVHVHALDLGAGWYSSSCTEAQSPHIPLPSRQHGPFTDDQRVHPLLHRLQIQNVHIVGHLATQLMGYSYAIFQSCIHVKTNQF